MTGAPQHPSTTGLEPGLHRLLRILVLPHVLGTLIALEDGA